MKLWQIIFGMLMATATIYSAFAYYDYDTFRRADNLSAGKTELLGVEWSAFFDSCELASIKNNEAFFKNPIDWCGGGLDYYPVTNNEMTAHWSVRRFNDTVFVIEPYMGNSVGNIYCDIFCGMEYGGGIENWSILGLPEGYYNTGISCYNNDWHDLWLYYDSVNSICKYKIDDTLFDNGGDGYQANIPFVFDTVHNRGFGYITDNFAVCSGYNMTCAPPSEELCVENWTAQYINESCNGTFINEIKTYADENDCGTAEELPVDNDTVSNTFFCGTGYAETYVMNDLDDIVVDGLGTAGAGFVKYLDLAITAVIAALVIAGVVSVSKMFVR
jgi:hypothetical protein